MQLRSFETQMKTAPIDWPSPPLNVNIFGTESLPSSLLSLSRANIFCKEIVGVAGLGGRSRTTEPGLWRIVLKHDNSSVVAVNLSQAHKEINSACESLR